MILSEQAIERVRAMVASGQQPRPCTVLRSYLAQLGHVLLRKSADGSVVIVLHPMTALPPDIDPKWLILLFPEYVPTKLGERPAKPQWSYEAMRLREVVRTLNSRLTACPYGCLTMDHGSSCPVGRAIRNEFQ